MIATMAQASPASYHLESQRSRRHPNEYNTAGEEPDGVEPITHTIQAEVSITHINSGPGDRGSR